MLPSTFDENGTASARQHLSCLIVDDAVAIDAGSLAMATSAAQKKQIRDVVVTHAHLDHIAGLPLFIDDLFATLDAPIRVHALPEIVETLERDIFNWEIYPRFSELENDSGAVMKYEPFTVGEEFSVRHLKLKSVPVNHKVSTVGFVVSDGRMKFAVSGDTAETDEFWATLNREADLSALLVECAFPNELETLAGVSHHLTPQKLRKELAKFHRRECSIYVINIKPMYRDRVVKQIAELEIENLQILEVGQIYEW